MEAYKFDAGTIKRAEKRSAQLYTGLMETGYALDEIEKALQALKRGADEMDDQPESDMTRSFANDLEVIYKDMKKRIKEWDSDRKAINYGIANFKEGKNG